MLGFNGGLLGVRKVTTGDAASGLWFQNEQSIARRASIWPATGDAYWNNVSLLLHMNGTNGSTTFTDSSTNAFTITANGNAQISTAQSKFGGASGSFDGSGDYIATPSNSALAFGTGDFTVELWLYINSFGGYTTLIGTRPDTSQYSDAWSIDYNGSGDIYGYSDNIIANSSGALSTGTWAHIALTRSSGTIYIFKNGSLLNSQANTQNFSRTTLYVGAAGNGGGASNSYIDDVRITKGVARYTASFTAPTAAFPDQG